MSSRSSLLSAMRSGIAGLHYPLNPRPYPQGVCLIGGRCGAGRRRGTGCSSLGSGADHDPPLTNGHPAMAAAVRLGIIGYGAQGGMYSRLLREDRVPGLTLGAICDIDDAVRARAAEENPGVPCHADWRELLSGGQ